MEELALLRAYEPVVRYTHGELFLPTAVGPYVQRCSLWIHEPGTPPDTAELLVPPGELSLERLAALGRDRRDRSLELRFVEQRPRGAAMRAWRRAGRRASGCWRGRSTRCCGCRCCCGASRRAAQQPLRR